MNYKQLRPVTKAMHERIYSILKIKYSNILENENTNVVDLFAGTGTLGFSIAKQHKIKSCFFVENNLSNFLKIKRMIDHKLMHNCKVIKCDCFKFNINMKFQLIFTDGPFKFEVNSKMINIINNNFMCKNGLVVMKKHIKEVLDLPNNLKIDHIYQNGYNEVMFIKNK